MVAGLTNTGRRGGDGDDDDLTQAGVHPNHLGDEDGGHRLVESRPVHVDGGPDGEDEPGDPGVDLVPLLETVDGDREGGGAAGGPEGRGQGRPHLNTNISESWLALSDSAHLPDESEGKRSGGERVDQRQDDEAVYGDAEGDGDQVPDQLGQLRQHGLHVKDFSRNEESDAQRSEVNHPGGQSHHHVAHGLEEVQQRLPLLSRESDGDAGGHGENDEAEDVGALGPGGVQPPGGDVSRIYESSSAGVFRLLVVGIHHGRLVLLHRGLDQVGREAVGDQIQQSVHGCPLRLLTRLNDLVRVGDAGSDGDTEDDAEGDGEECCQQVVEDGPPTDLAAHPEVQLADGSNQTGNYQGDDEAFQHVEEDLARVANIVRLSGSVETISH